MAARKELAFLYHFDQLEDPRIDRKKLYPLKEILLIVLAGGVCGVKSWRDLVSFGEAKLRYLRRFSAFENGVPSKNTFARVFSALDPGVFKECFMTWVRSFQLAAKEVIAIDGKALRGSFDKAQEQSAVHMISAFATSVKLVLGQEKVNEKSNEVTAIPKLLDLLSIKGAIVSIDAMGAQKKIAKKIREKKADYVLSLKENQASLHSDVELFLWTEIDKLKHQKENCIADVYEDCDKGHGRVEKRICYVSNKLNWLNQRSQWCDLNTIAMLESEVTIGEKTTTQKRYFISSLPADAKEIAQAVRSHWAIENSLHWVLDVTLGEDNSRIRVSQGFNAPLAGLTQHSTPSLCRNFNGTAVYA